MQREVLKGHLDLLLLATVAEEPAHGYLVVERLKERTGGELDLAEGTVYPALHRLERQGLLESSWATAAGRRRRVYRLTRRGHDELAATRSDWTRFSRAVGAVVA
ncbi:MAG TPA: helix-turn-helix transcriptional regulator [Gaiellaceae bacterium]|nr:helix-turn-helix transcriptional regulator [Gaiellaceae bacterium]